MSLRLGAALFMAVLAFSAAALAQPPAAGAGKRVYEPYAAATFGFAVSLPDGGTTVDPSDADWKNDKEVAFEWYGDPTDPVVLIQARVDDLSQDIDADTFRIFADALLANWSEPKDARKEGEVAADATPSPFQVLNTADNLLINGRTWNLIEVADRSDQATTVYYSVFSTYAGTKIYTVTLYYLDNQMQQVQEFGKPILQGFKVL